MKARRKTSVAANRKLRLLANPEELVEHLQLQSGDYGASIKSRV